MIDMKSLIKLQGKYSNNFYDPSKLCSKEKQEILKTLCLSLHEEASNISSSLDVNNYHPDDSNIDSDNLIYHTVDSLRYLFATINLYEIMPEEIVSAYIEKDITLNMQYNYKPPEKCQKVVIVDIDDVICHFRSHFNGWLKEHYQVDVDKNSTSYYSSKEVTEAGLSPERVFETFIKSNGFKDIPIVKGSVGVLNVLKNKGYYIQLLTSRPSSNLRCKYQTFEWLKRNNIPHDNIGFTPEKYLWLSKKDYYIDNRVVFAIDDSAKHAMEYSTHGIKCLMPETSYNVQANHENIVRFSHSTKEDFEKILCNF